MGSYKKTIVFSLPNNKQTQWLASRHATPGLTLGANGPAKPVKTGLGYSQVSK